jgi:hypothetical protein
MRARRRLDICCRATFHGPLQRVERGVQFIATRAWLCVSARVSTWGRAVPLAEAWDWPSQETHQTAVYLALTLLHSSSSSSSKSTESPLAACAMARLITCMRVRQRSLKLRRYQTKKKRSRRAVAPRNRTRAVSSERGYRRNMPTQARRYRDTARVRSRNSGGWR